MNRHFPAKRAKYWNVHIIKTTASIITKFCRVIETPKYSLLVVQICPQTNPRWPPSWKISITSQPIDRFWENLACWCDASRPSGEWQCKTGGVRRLAVANDPVFQMLLVICNAQYCIPVILFPMISQMLTAKLHFVIISLTHVNHSLGKVSQNSPRNRRYQPPTPVDQTLRP